MKKPEQKMLETYDASVIVPESIDSPNGRRIKAEFNEIYCSFLEKTIH